MFPDAWLSLHARTAMARRGIAERDVRRVLASPDAVVSGDRPDRCVAQGRFAMGDPPRAMLLRIVVDTGPSQPDVVTFHATTQFRRSGAKP